MLSTDTALVCTDTTLASPALASPALASPALESTPAPYAPCAVAGDRTYAKGLAQSYYLGVTEQTVRQWRAQGWGLHDRINERARLNAYAYQGGKQRQRREPKWNAHKHTVARRLGVALSQVEVPEVRYGGDGYAEWESNKVAHPAAELLLSAARVLALQPGASSHVESDAMWDVKRLQAEWPLRFVWATGSYGTVLYTPAWCSPETSAAQSFARWLREQPGARCYLYDGGRLYHVENGAHAVEFLRRHAGRQPPRVARLVVRDGHMPRLMDTLAWAYRVNKLGELLRHLQDLRDYGEGAYECHLYPEHRGRSFDWQLVRVGVDGKRRCVLNGGLIYHHGPGDGEDGSGSYSVHT